MFVPRSHCSPAALIPSPHPFLVAVQVGPPDGKDSQVQLTCPPSVGKVGLAPACPSPH